MGNQESPRFIPFADIRFPEEPPLEGVPKGLQDTLLFPELPALNLAARILNSYRKANSDGRRQVVEETVAEILKRPGNFGNLLEAWREIAESEDRQSDLFDLKEKLIKSLFREIDSPRFSPTAEYFEDLLPKIITGDEVAEGLLQMACEKAITTPQTVEAFYSLAVAMMHLDRPEIYQYALAILLHQVDWLNADSLQAKNLYLARYETDDQILEKVFAITAAVNVSAQYSAVGINQVLWEIQKKLLVDSEVMGRLNQQKAKDRVRFNQLANFYKGDQDAPFFKNINIQEIDRNDFPYRLLYKGNTLRKLVSQKELEVIASQNGHVKYQKERLLLPGGIEAIIVFPPETHPQKRKAFLKLAFSLVPEEKLPKFFDSQNGDFLSPVGRMEDGDIEMFFQKGPELEDKTPYLWLVAETLKPQLSLGQIEKLGELNERLKKEILSNCTHFISPCGDLVLITDQLLKTEGYQSIRFDLGDPKSTTQVTLRVGEFDFGCLLDQRNSLFWPKSEYQLSAEGRVWLEYLILSHLKELRCGERLEVVNTRRKKDGQEEKKEFFSRRATFRHLPLGHYPTYEQYLAALDEYDVDVVERNRLRSQAGKKRMETFVFDSIKILNGHQGKPFICKAPQATLELSKIF